MECIRCGIWISDNHITCDDCYDDDPSWEADDEPTGVDANFDSIEETSGWEDE